MLWTLKIFNIRRDPHEDDTNNINNSIIRSFQTKNRNERLERGEITFDVMQPQDFLLRYNLYCYKHFNVNQE